jgi:hypothetical protein
VRRLPMIAPTQQQQQQRRRHHVQVRQGLTGRVGKMSRIPGAGLTLAFRGSG